MLKSAFLIFIFVFSAPFAQAQYPYGSVTYDSLKRLIIENNVVSIEELLPLLPESFRSHYALMFNSRSLQEASYGDPRVILYGPEAKLVVTFNGQAGQRGFNALETMEFDDATKTFRFHEVTFPGRSTARGESASRIGFSDSNPDQCLKCHGRPPRPIWDTYPLWPGAYGERDHFSLSKKEREGLAEFLRNQPSHPRNRHLIDPKLFLERDNLLARSATRYDGSDSMDPNSELNALLSRLNFRAIAAEVGHASGFGVYQYALLAALQPECGGIEDFLPEKIRSSYTRSYDAFAADTDRINRDQDHLKLLRTLGGSPADNPLPMSTAAGGAAAAKFRYLVEQGLRISTDQWSPALEKATYDFSTAGLSIMDLRPYLLEEVSRRDDRVRDLSATSASSSRFCSYLKTRSLRALAGVPTPPVAVHGVPKTVAVAEKSGPSTFPGHPLLQRCIACHEGGVGPALVFSNQATLARELRERRYSRGHLLDEILFRLSPEAGARRMPVGLNISEDERKSLERYFRNLASLGEGARN